MIMTLLICRHSNEWRNTYMVDIVLDRFFSPKSCHFFSTSMADFSHFVHWVTCFNWFFWSIISARVPKTNFWTCYLMLGTWKPPLNTGDFEVFSHLFSFCITFYALKSIQNLQDLLPCSCFDYWDSFLLCFSFLSFKKAMLLNSSAICEILA